MVTIFPANPEPRHRAHLALLCRGVVLLSALLWVPVVSATEPCSFTQPAWNRLAASQRQRALEATDATSLNDTCFFAYVRQCRQAGLHTQADQELTARLQANPVTSLHRLDYLIWLVMAVADTPAAAALLNHWEKKQGPLDERIRLVRSQSRHRTADTLFTLYDAAGRLDAYDLIIWSDVRLVLDDWKGVGQLYCRIGAAQPELLPSLRIRWQDAVRLADESRQELFVEAFSACAAHHSSRTTRDALAEWLGTLHPAQAAARRSPRGGAPRLQGTDSHEAQLLFEQARTHAFNRDCERLIPAVSRAMILQTDVARRVELAAAAAQTCRHGPHSDSVRSWLGRLGAQDDNQRTMLAAACQVAGLQKRADSLIALLPAGEAGDTLRLRSRLFANNPAGARALTGTEVPVASWPPAQRILWQTRIAVFGADHHNASALLDTLTVDPRWPGGQELLRHKYAHTLLAGDDEARGQWSRLSLAIYLQTPGLSADSIAVDRLLPAAAELLLATLADAALQQGDADAALTATSRLAPDRQSVRLRYYRGRALAAAGRMDEARKVYEQIILNAPQDVFSEKARIALHGLTAGHVQP